MLSIPCLPCQTKTATRFRVRLYSELSLARILVVDDDRMVRRLMADCLAEAGHRVREASNAEEAMDSILADEDFSLIITDVRMPGACDGFGLSRWVKSRRPATKVLVVSGYAGDPQADIPRHDAFLSKPFTASS